MSRTTQELSDDAREEHDESVRLRRLNDARETAREARAVLSEVDPFSAEDVRNALLVLAEAVVDLAEVAR